MNEVGADGIWRVEARNASKRPAVYRPAPHSIKLYSKNISSHWLLCKTEVVNIYVAKYAFFRESSPEYCLHFKETFSLGGK